MILEKLYFCGSLGAMMNSEMSVREILEWYDAAGVDVTVGSVPFALVEKDAVLTKMPLRESTKEVAKPQRQATTELAQATQEACKNAKDLCQEIDSLDKLREAVENFEGCSLKLTATHTVFGDGNPQAKIVLVGEAPGADEDRIGRPFVGRSGQLLDKMLKAAGLGRDSCYITNVLPWRPPGNRTPTDGEIAVCLPFLKRQIDLIKPDYILLLGGSAANALLENAETISKLRGHWLSYQTTEGKDIKALATFHPAYLLRNTGQKAKAWADMLRLVKDYGLEKTDA